jgi:hypothetical protein
MINNVEQDMTIEVVGDGCIKCKDLRIKVQQAVYELNLPAKVTSVMDLEQLAHLKALSQPQLVIDGTIFYARGLLSVAEIKAVLQRVEAQNAGPFLKQLS